MSTKEEKFKPKRSQGTSKAGLSKASGGSDSKNVNTAGGGGMGKANQIPCFHNGKLATPQSLLPRKESGTVTKQKHKGDAVAIPKPIEENITDLPHRPPLHSAHSMLADKKKSDITNSSMNKKLSSGFGMSKSHEEKVVEETTSIHLTETVTEIILRIPSLIFASDAPHKDLIVVDDNNTRYDNVIAAHSNADAFSVRAMQTINNPTKVKEEMTSANPLRDAGSQALSYDVLDGTRTNTVAASDTDHVGVREINKDITQLDEAAGVAPSVHKFVSDGLSVALAAGGCLLDTTTVGRAAPVADVKVEAKKDIKRGNAKRPGGGPSLAQDASMGGIAGADASVASASNGLQAPASASAPMGGAMESGELSDGVSGFGLHGGISTAGEGGDAASYVEQDSIQILRDKQAQSIVTSKSLLKKLNLIERAVQQNAYHKEHLDYRDLPDIAPLQLSGQDKAHSVDAEQLFGAAGGFKAAVVAEVVEETASPETDEVEAVEAHHSEKGMSNGVSSAFTRKLFSWANIDLVRGRAVTAMAANTANPDIMAVGYGQLDTVPNEEAEDENGKSYGGLVLFWSLRNPDYPEKILRTPHPVTALNFSQLSPTLIAVGLYNGELMIYDVKRENDWGTPVESSQNVTGGHSDPIW